MEILSVDRVLNKKTFTWKNCVDNVHQKIVPHPLLVLVNNPKQKLRARNSFKSKIF